MGSFVHLLDQRRLIGAGGSTVDGVLYFYYSGTSTLAPIYKDSSLLIPSENPVSVGAGEILPSIFLDTAITYRRVIQYSDGTVDEQDPLGVLATEGEVGVPVGSILDYGGGTLPTGFLFCDGSAVSRTTYAALFTAIGTTHGAGNGTTTFNLPDYRGRVGAGKDNMGGVSANRLSTQVTGTTLGATGGAEEHTLTSSQIPAHTHPVTDPGHTHATSATGSGQGHGGSLPNTVEYGSANTGSNTTGITVGNNTGGGSAHTNVQPTIVCNKIIKAVATDFLSLFNLLPDYVSQVSLALDSGADMVGFAVLASPTSGTLAHKFKKFGFITDAPYGAVGDGLTDDTAAIQAAFDDLDYVVIPSTDQYYKVTGNIDIDRVGGIRIEGQGKKSLIKTTSSAANIFTVNTTWVSIDNISLESTVTRSGGYYIDVNNAGDRFYLSNFWMSGALNAIRIADGVATATIQHGTIIDSIATTGVPIRVEGNNDLDITIRDILCDQGSQIFSFLYLVGGGDVTVEACQLIHCGNVIYADVPAGKTLSSLWVGNFTWLDNSTRPVYLKASGGTIVRTKISTTWLSSSSNEGVRLETSLGGSIAGVEIHDNHIFANVGNGIAIIDTGVVGVSIHDNIITGCTGNAVDLAAGVSHVTIKDNVLGSGWGFGGNNRALNIAAGAGDYIAVNDNYMVGNTNVPVIGATGSNVQVDDNLGYDHPWSTYTPTVSAGGGSFTTVSATGRYRKKGKTYYIQASVVITTNGGAGTDVRITLPNGITPSGTFVLAGQETQATGMMVGGRAVILSNLLRIAKYDGTYPGADGRTLVVSGVLEAA